MKNTERDCLTIISYDKLNQKEIDLIVKSLPPSFPKQGKINNLVDSSLLAGVVIKYRSKIMDLSLRKTLTDLSEQLIRSL